MLAQADATGKSSSTTTARVIFKSLMKPDEDDLIYLLGGDYSSHALSLIHRKENKETQAVTRRCHEGFVFCLSVSFANMLIRFSHDPLWKVTLLRDLYS